MTLPHFFPLPTRLIPECCSMEASIFLISKEKSAEEGVPLLFWWSFLLMNFAITESDNLEHSAQPMVWEKQQNKEFSLVLQNVHGYSEHIPQLHITKGILCSWFLLCIAFKNTHFPHIQPWFGSLDSSTRACYKTMKCLSCSINIT